MTDTGFPLAISERYREYKGDPVQNLLAPFIREANIDVYGCKLKFEYIELKDAYAIVKETLAGDKP